MAARAPQPLRAVGLIAESYGDEAAERGKLTWTGSEWRVTGDAAWLLTEFHAILPSASGPREVHPSEGSVYLYAVWRSMFSTYFGVRLFDASGTFLDQDELLAAIATIQRGTNADAERSEDRK